MDCNLLNNEMKNSYHLPRIHCFCQVLKRGYCHVETPQLADCGKIELMLKKGLWKFTVKPFGLSNASADKAVR